MFFWCRNARQFDQIVKEIQKIMPAIDDLKTAITRLTGSVSTELKAVVDKLNQPSTTDADISAAAGQILTLADRLDAESAILAAPATPAPPAA